MSSDWWLDSADDMIGNLPLPAKFLGVKGRLATVLSVQLFVLYLLSIEKYLSPANHQQTCVGIARRSYVDTFNFFVDFTFSFWFIYRSVNETTHETSAMLEND